LRADLDQWHRIVDAANAITRSWNALFDTPRGVTFAQAAGDAGLVAAADAYLAAAQAQLPALRAEVGAGRFAPLAARRVALTEAEIAYVTLLRQAVAASDGEVWDRAVDALSAVEEADGALKAEVERQCEFWRSRR